MMLGSLGQSPLSFVRFRALSARHHARHTTRQLGSLDAGAAAIPYRTMQARAGNRLSPIPQHPHTSPPGLVGGSHQGIPRHTHVSTASSAQKETATEADAPQNPPERCWQKSSIASGIFGRVLQYWQASSSPLPQV